MNRNTPCILGQLRVGDRFRYHKRVDVWEVIASTSKTAFINQPGLNGVYIHKYETPKSNNTAVIFLRHTIPLPGEQCLIQDLKTGNVFHLLTDIISEYKLIELRDLQFVHIGIVKGKEPSGPLNPSDFVVFVRDK